MGEIEQALARFEDRAVRFDPEVIARGGAFVSLDASGAPKIERGFVRPEDLAPAPAQEPSPDTEAPTSDGSVQRAVFTVGGATGGPREPDPTAEPDEDATGRLSDRLMTELSAHRTLALREALANDPDTAFLAVLHALALQTFYGSYTVDTCLEIEAKSVSLKTAARPDLNDTPGAQSSQQSATDGSGEAHQTSGSSVPAAQRGQRLRRRRHPKLLHGVQGKSCTPAMRRAGEREGNPSQSKQKLALKALSSGERMPQLYFTDLRQLCRPAIVDGVIMNFPPRLS